MLEGLSLGLVLVVWRIAAASAQVVPDNTLPTNTDVSSSDSLNFTVTGGTRRGSNLFHSFEKFSVPAEGSAIFEDSSLTTETIFSRVTGSSPSSIDGLIGITSSANLFFVNPNGIVFGENAALDIGGSFIATTADAIVFADDTRYSATNPQQAPLLTMSVPRGLQMGDIPGAIRLDGAELVGAGGRTLGLIGGDVILDESNLVTPQGRIELGSLAPNTLAELIPIEDALSSRTQAWTFDYRDTVAFQNIRLVNGSIVGTGDRGGNVQVYGRQVQVREESQIRLLAEGTGDFDSLETAGIEAGSLVIWASESVNIVGSTLRQERTTGLFNEVAGDVSGEGRELRIEAPQLSVRNGAQISGNTLGRGQGVALIVRVDGVVKLDGISIDENLTIQPSGLFSRAADTEADSGLSGGVAMTSRGGDLTLEAARLSLSNGAQISTSTLGRGNAGNLSIVAETILVNGGAFSGDSPGLPRDAVDDLTLPTSGLFASVEPGDLPLGNGGNIDIEAEQLTLRQGGQIATTAQGNGNGGILSIVADRIHITGASSNTPFRGAGRSGLFVSAEPAFETAQGVLQPTTADAGRLVVQAGTLMVEENGLISADNFGADNRGADVELTLGRLVLRGGGQIGAGSLLEQNFTTVERGPGGTVRLAVSGIIDISGAGQLDTAFPSAILTQAEGTGDAGDIIIDGAGGELIVILRDGGAITASTTGIDGADAGDIAIAAESVVLEGGVISSEVGSTSAGNGGNIVLNAETVTLSDRSRISARSDAGFAAPGDSSSQSTGALPGQGNAGTILLRLGERLTVTDSDITTQAESAAGGAIAIDAGDIRLTGDGDIRTNVQSGADGGGDITLVANAIVAFDDSDILAFAQQGAGGNIRLDTPAFFGQDFDVAAITIDPAGLDGNDRVDINASGAIAGAVSLPDVSFIQNSLADLPEGVITADDLIANSCVMRNEDGRSTFVITGASGLPEQPGEGMSDYPTGTVQSIPAESSSLWEPGDPVVEAESIHRLPNGELVASHSCRPSPAN